MFYLDLLCFIKLWTFLTLLLWTQETKAIPVLSNGVSEITTLDGEIVPLTSVHGIFNVKLLSKDNNPTSWDFHSTLLNPIIQLRFEVVSQIKENLSNFDVQLELNNKNDAMSSEFPHLFSEISSTTTTGSPECHYTGRVTGSPLSSAAFNLCNGMQGALRFSPEHEYRVQTFASSSNATRIVLIRSPSSTLQQYLYRRQASTKTVYVLVGYFANGNTARSSLEATKQIFQIANSIFSSQGQAVGLQLVLKAVVDVSPQLLQAQATPRDPSALLKAWCEFWRTRFSTSTDAGYLITFDTMYSGGSSGSGCQIPPGVSCGIVQGSNDPRQVALSLLHGIGHTLGVSHDTEEKCGANGIMRLPFSASSTAFSQCSVDELKTYFDTHDVQVLVKSQVDTQINYAFYNPQGSSLPALPPPASTPPTLTSPSSSTTPTTTLNIVISTRPPSASPTPIAAPSTPVVVPTTPAPAPTTTSTASRPTAISVTLPTSLFPLTTTGVTPVIPFQVPQSSASGSPQAPMDISEQVRALMEPQPQAPIDASGAVAQANAANARQASAPMVQGAPVFQAPAFRPPTFVTQIVETIRPERTPERRQSGLSIRIV